MQVEGGGYGTNGTIQSGSGGSAEYSAHSNSVSNGSVRASRSVWRSESCSIEASTACLTLCVIDKKDGIRIFGWPYEVALEMAEKYDMIRHHFI